MSRLICHLCHYNPETTSGTFIDGLNRVASVAEKRFDARTLCVFPKNASGRPWLKRLNGPHLCADPDEIKYDLTACFKTADTVILHSHFVGYDGAAARLSIPYRKKYKTVLHLHSEAPASRVQLIKDWVKMHALGSFAYDRCIAVSQKIYDQAVQRRAVPCGKLKLVDNGIDVARYRADSWKRRDMRGKMGLKPSDTAVLLLGWDPARKGVDLFLDAVTWVPGDSVVFFIVGKGPMQHFVQEHMKGKKHPPRVRLIEPTEDFPALLNAIDVFVSASRSEGAPYAVLEAMAAEKMVIASTASCPSGMGSGVWLYPTTNRSSLSTLMTQAITTSEDDRSKIGRANRQIVEWRGSLDTWAEQVADVYEELWQPKERVNLAKRKIAEMAS